jgi:hypothetical protein
MSIRVGELVSQLRSRSRTVSVPLRAVRLLSEGDDAGTLVVGDERFAWGGRTLQALSAFIKGPSYKYLEREPLGWQREVIQHHVNQRADNMSIWYVEGDNVAGVYDEDAKVVPLVRVAEEVADIFGPDDIANVLWAPDQVEINVTSEFKSVTVPGRDGFPNRYGPGEVEHPYHPERQVGDMTCGGIRVKIQPGRPERAPVVEEFWETLACLNGMTRQVTGSQINLRGRTVDEIMHEMNNVMRVIWEGLDASAHAIHASALTPIPGSREGFIREVAGERGINARTVLRLQERAAELPEDASIYDITQIITGMANEESMPVATRRRLQEIGGDLTVDTQRMIHRCITCERPLPA